MSLRSIGGVSGCLRGRQALRRPQKSTLPRSSHCGLPDLRQHSSDAGQFTPFTEQTDPIGTRWSTLNGIHIQHVGSSSTAVANKSTAQRSKPAQTSRNDVLPRQDNHSSQTLGGIEAIKIPSPEHNARITANGLDWASMHDKFLDIRREAPDQMAIVFRKEMLFASQFIGDFLHDEKSLSEFKQKWNSLGMKEQDRILPKLLIGSLVQSASQILFVLSGVTIFRRAFRIRMNCLRSVSLMYHADIKNDPTLQNVYETQIDGLRSPDSWPADKMPAVLLQNLLHWSSPEQCQNIIGGFLRKWPAADDNALTAIIDHYLRIGDAERAFDHLKRLSGEALREPNPVVKGFRDRLLKLDVVARTDDGANFKYLPQLLALGMPSDETLHNAVIESAIRNELPDVAWDVYKYLEEGNFTINARSHLVLLRDAFDRGALSRVNAIMTAIHLRQDLTSDPYLVVYSMNIVRVICYNNQKVQANQALAHITALYDRAFDRSPLVKLNIMDERVDGEDLPQPTAVVLAFTIWTFVLVQRQEAKVSHLWEWIKHLISTGDKVITDAARSDVIYNGLILFYARRAHNLPRSLEILQHMLSSELCLPTSRTWSILLCSLLRHGQIDQAKLVLDMMERKGFKVQDVQEQYSTYLPAGYNLEKLAEMTGETLDETRLPEAVEQAFLESA